MAKLLFSSAPRCVESWLRRAAKFREYAHEDLRAGRYDSAAFFAQQSVELALKALLIKLTGSRPQTHATGDLLGLVEKALGVVFPEDVRRCAELLEQHYIQPRCPEARLSDYRRWEAEEAVECMEKVWAHVVDKYR